MLRRRISERRDIQGAQVNRLEVPLLANGLFQSREIREIVHDNNSE
jgi:hypothetical protein